MNSTILNISNLSKGGGGGLRLQPEFGVGIQLKKVVNTFL